MKKILQYVDSTNKKMLYLSNQFLFHVILILFIPLQNKVMIGKLMKHQSRDNVNFSSRKQ